MHIFCAQNGNKQINFSKKNWDKFIPNLAKFGMCKKFKFTFFSSFGQSDNRRKNPIKNGSNWENAKNYFRKLDTYFFQIYSNYKCCFSLKCTSFKINVLPKWICALRKKFDRKKVKIDTIAQTYKLGKCPKKVV